MRSTALHLFELYHQSLPPIALAMIELGVVHILKRSGRNNWFMRYVDPYTSNQVTKSTGCSKKKDAERTAGVWQDELRRDVYAPTNRNSWADLIEHYKTHKLCTKCKGAATDYLATISVFGRFANPQRLADFTTERVTRFAADCREAGLAEATIARHLRGPQDFGPVDSYARHTGPGARV